MIRPRTIVFNLALLIAGFASRAQEPVRDPNAIPAGPLPGHSYHGEAFNEGPRQRAYVMGTTANIDFPVSTKSPLAQKFFNQGVGQLHGFWYLEAERSFRQASAIEPNCAMFYWGMAMANIHNEKRAREFIANAMKRRENATPHELSYITSVANYYRDDKKEYSGRNKDYADALERITKAFPFDIEAKAFYALQLWENNGGMAVAERERVNKLLNEVLAVNPMHPCHHYRIHLWNYQKDENAVNSAALCGQSAPGIAHMWHMPGHTFSQLKRYADAAWQQEASARTDHAQMIRDRLLPDQIHNYAHNNEWLIRDLIHTGRVHDAIDLAKNMIELPRHPQYNDFKKGGSSGYGRERLFDVLVKYELWDELIRLCHTVYLEPTDIEAHQATRLRFLGVAYFSKGDIASGKAQLAELEPLLKKQQDVKQKAGDDAVAEAQKKGETGEKLKTARDNATGWMDNDLKKSEEAVGELRAYQSLAEGKTEEAKKRFDEVKWIPKDRLAQVWMKLGDIDKAVAAAQEASGPAKNEVQPLANLVDILNRAGKSEEAVAKFKELQPISGQIDMDAPIFQRIAPVARLVSSSSDWRTPYVPASDSGKRPPLDSLGPFRWHPPTAPDWALRTAAGKRIALKDYRGRPIVVLFFLGHGCAHCLEQLNAFSPAAKDFQAAGISIVAVSTENAEGLRQTIAAAKEGFPFPLVSDSSLATFKAYRAYDDFEKMPLHGAFLIDGQGLVRWQDVNYEPFKDTAFLLNESKRLLQQDKPILAASSTRLTSR